MSRLSRCFPVLSLLSLVACVPQIRVEELDCSRKASTYPNHEDSFRFFIGAEILGPERENEVERLFGRNPNDFEVLPVLIALENQSEAHCTVTQEELSFTLEDGTEFDPLTQREAYNETRYSGWRSVWAFPFAVLPMFFLLRDVSEANEVIEKAFEEKGFRDYNVPPGGEPVCRILFFRSPVDLDDVKLRDSTLRVTYRRRAPAEAQGPSGAVTVEVFF